MDMDASEKENNRYNKALKKTLKFLVVALFIICFVSFGTGLWRQGLQTMGFGFWMLSFLAMPDISLQHAFPKLYHLNKRSRIYLLLAVICLLCSLILWFNEFSEK